MPNRKVHFEFNTRFGRLLTIREEIRPNAGKLMRFIFCRCDCGKEVWVPLNRLRNFKHPTRSCGCLFIDRLKQRSTKHGLTRTNEYAIWSGIVTRCCNPNFKMWRYYGGRGIKICDKWRYSFEAFLSDVGKRPGKEFSIDRINNDGNYEPGNVRWATRIEQANNRRDRQACL